MLTVVDEVLLALGVGLGLFMFWSTWRTLRRVRRNMELLDVWHAHGYDCPCQRCKDVEAELRQLNKFE